MLVEKEGCCWSNGQCPCLQTAHPEFDSRPGDSPQCLDDWNIKIGGSSGDHYFHYPKKSRSNDQDSVSFPSFRQSSASSEPFLYLL